MQIVNRALSAALIVGSAMLLSQCSQSSPSNPVSPQSVSSGTTNAVGDTTTSTPAFSRLKVCKVGNVSGTFSVSAAPASGGSPTVLSPITVAAGQCRIVAEDFDTATGVGGNITVRETSAGLQSISAQRIDAPAGTISSFTFTNGQTLFLNSFHGYTITFTNNVPPPPPPPGDEGCTPGYWKQDQHFDNWTGLSTGADFDTTFGVNFFTPNITLLQALNRGGGGVNALARHAVAALLNAASADVDYRYTTAEVLAIVRGTGVYAGRTIEERKDLLAAANELGCPLN
ncbi:MAG TPA: hypothetical protein VES67_03960 [Vicinamibacterales bacterium]|nr:hypothetical protein [Vicinamibacterales bacterium]